MCTGAEAAAAASMAQGLAGEKQLGGMAPAHVGGGYGGAPLGGGLGQTPPMPNPPPSLESLGSPLASQQNEVMNPAQVGQMGPPAGGQGVMGPPEELAGPANQGGFGGFFGNLDQNLQSPSKVIGMGLLNQIDPALGAGGLLAGGLFGKNKVFGQR